MFAYSAKSVPRIWARFIHLFLAGMAGWILSSQWLHGQEDWVTDMGTRPATQTRHCLEDHGIAGQLFWQAPGSPQRSVDTTFRITKQPFRYGDFGAISYPQRYQSSNYYGSRTDWAWQ